jgi:hypothetical protein
MATEVSDWLKTPQKAFNRTSLAGLARLFRVVVFRVVFLAVFFGESALFDSAAVYY